MMQSIFVVGLVLAAILYFRCGKSGTGSNNHLGHGFTLKKDSLFFFDRPLDQVDIANFSVLDESYARDKNHIYYYASERQSKDYFTTKKLSFEIVQNARPETFTALGYGYGKDNIQGFYKGHIFEIKDAPSFELLDHHWMKDVKVAYADRIEIKDSDGESFELLSSPYAKDKNNVYFGEGLHDGHTQIKIISKNPATFSVLEHPYAKDAQSVFYFDEPIPGAEPTGFQILGHGYSRDIHEAYFQNQPMKISDPASFQPCRENENFNGTGAFARDKNNVYYQDRAIRNVDLPSFVILNEFYSKDKKAVYFTSEKVTHALPKSFEVFPHDLGDSDAKDERHAYYRGQRIDLAE